MPESSFLSALDHIKLGSLSLADILGAVITFLVCLIVINVVLRILGRVLGKARKINQTIRGFILGTAKILFWMIVIIIVAGQLGIPTASLVALLSVAGLALSLSVQGVMSNLFSGITLLLTHPFAEGDFVELAGKTGTIKSIGLIYTTINTLDNVVINIPNGDVIGSSVTNYSAEDMRRVDMTFCAAYTEPTEKVKAAIMEVIRADGRIAETPAPFIALGAFKENMIEYIVRVWVKNADYWDVHFALNENVRESFARNGVALSFPHMNVHIVEK